MECHHSTEKYTRKKQKLAGTRCFMGDGHNTGESYNTNISYNPKNNDIGWTTGHPVSIP
jgi:hypothetical protein